MYKFGKRSRDNLATCHSDLQVIMNDLIKIMNVSVICGERTEEEQNEAFAKGNSKLKFPESKHNASPSNAVDVVPYPVDWNDIARFKEMVWAIKGIAAARGIDIRCGADFKSFKDYPHIELVS